MLLNKQRFDQSSCSGKSGTRWPYRVPKWYEIVKRLGTTCLTLLLPGGLPKKCARYQTVSCNCNRSPTIMKYMTFYDNLIFTLYTSYQWFLTRQRTPRRSSTNFQGAWAIACPKTWKV